MMDASEPCCSVRVRIEGRVQGIGYRAWTEHEAIALRLTGWVRNRRDGTVEAVFCGPAHVVQTMLAFCRQGPPGAKVTNLELLDDEAGSFDSFEVLPTG